MNKRFMKLFLSIFASLAILVALPVAYFGITSTLRARDELNARFAAQQEELAGSLSSVLEEKFSNMRDAVYFLQNEEWIFNFCKYGCEAGGFDVVTRMKCVGRVKNILGNAQIAKDMLIIAGGQNAIISSVGWFTPSQYAFTFYYPHMGIFSDMESFSVPFPCGDPDCQNAYCRNIVPVKFSPYALKLPYDVYITLDRRLISEYVSKISSGSELKIRIELNGAELYDTLLGATADKTIYSDASGVSYYYGYPQLDPMLMSGVVASSAVAYSLFFLLAIMLTAGLALLVTKPMHRIIMKLPGGASAPGANPLRLIERGMDSMGEQLDKYKRIVSNDDLLLNILISGDTERYLPDIMDFWPWFNAGGYCAISLIDCPPPERLESERDFASLLSALGEAVTVEYRVMNIVGSDAALLIYFGGDHKRFESGEYQAQYEDIVASVRAISPGLRAGFGSISRGVAGIQTSYHQARKQYLAAAYADPSDADVKYFYPIAMELQLLSNLKLAKREVCLEILGVIFSQNAARKLPANQYARCLSILSDTLARFSMENDVEPGEYPGEIQKCIRAHDFASAQATIEELCEYLCESASRAKTRGRDDKKREIYDYVVSRASDPNLSLQMISDKFGIPISTLSKVFKEIAGSNFYDFLSGLRVERAVEKLRGGNSTITEIAQMVGYDNYASFKRAFVKHMGVNPSEYKALHIDIGQN